MRSIILLSGGLDSMACIQFYRDLKYEIEAIFFDYGQPAKEKEKQSAIRISQYFQIPLHCHHIGKLIIAPNGEVISRNAIFILHAFSLVGFGTYKIILGVHDGTSFPDCTRNFVDKINDVLTLYSDGRIICEAPFIEFYKPEIIEYIRNKSLPIDLTYSCEKGGPQPCGECLSCLDRKEWLKI